MSARQVDPDDPLVQMNVRIPQSLKDALDARRKTKGMSRDVWVERALKFALSRAAKPAAQPLTNSTARTAPPPNHR